ncbi:MAG: type II secretion system protein GspM [Acidobacteriota bacterium]
MKISTREKRVLVVGGVIAAAVIAFYVAPLVLPEDLDVTVRQKQNALRQDREILGLEEGYKARISEAQHRLKQDQDRLLPGDNAAAAGAYLQKVLQEFADANQVEITRKTPLQDQKQDILTKVSYGLDINCSIDQLIRFLTAIENNDKFLRVENLQIISRLQPQRNRDEIMIPSLRIVGYIATPAPAQKAAEKTAGGH